MTLNKKQLEAKEILKKQYIKPTSQIVIFIKKVSPSGMSRQMLVGVIQKNKFYNITYYINQLLDQSTEKDFVRVGGCGMDMAFWLADTITYKLYDGKTPKNATGNGGTCLDWTTIY